MTAPGIHGGKRTWAPLGRVAPLLLLGAAMSSSLGCLNVLLDPAFPPTVDHAPVLVGMLPEPTFGRIPANVGSACAPTTTFVATRVDDADLDPLTVRWTLRVPSNDNPDGQPFILLETELDPLPTPLADGRQYDFAPFQLDPVTVLSRLGGVIVADQVAHHSDEGQLLELRVSDGGFKAGTDTPPDGHLQAFESWAILLEDTPCGT